MLFVCYTTRTPAAGEYQFPSLFFAGSFLSRFASSGEVYLFDGSFLVGSFPSPGVGFVFSSCMDESPASFPVSGFSLRVSFRVGS